MDFSQERVTVFENLPPKKKCAYYDLASLSKPLTLAGTFVMNPEMYNNHTWMLLLDHRAGLPAWGRLSSNNWKEQILSYKITESAVCYSDFSALRLMLEIEKKRKTDLFTLCSSFWDKELAFWRDIPSSGWSPLTGFRNKAPISGIVNDDNAMRIGGFCSHAGLFATIEGLCKSMVNLNKNYGLLKLLKEKFNRNNRFICGWDIANNHNSLAGQGHSSETVGHLGFTGTSIWIDLKQNFGYAILTNATKKYCYDRNGLNHLRREIGSFIWSKYCN
jgi:hypothetical protein